MDGGKQDAKCAECGNKRGQGRFNVYISSPIPMSYSFFFLNLQVYCLHAVFAYVVLLGSVEVGFLHLLCFKE